ncbi:MAG: gamma-glutamylcyclotransferase [Aestuariivita sp.]|nr:gamma-glutamylcyclotransferase [Aestuariivita sp.]MCY4289782.1 gamma-glutamylcyclotransferase [Aestuariivita sp.]MCY4347411.1 gamma-glutamylcyclotransferase [Aestuariivita sp.]
MALWVFGYGSLLWDPCFQADRQQRATITGYARSFCMSSIHHRGTEAQPGLVLALDETSHGRCDGIAMRVCKGTENTALSNLRARELVSSAYLEKDVEVMLADGKTISALVYVIDKQHRQYMANITLERQAQIIASAVGGRGRNSEYLFKTASHLKNLGVDDPSMDWLVQRVRELSP